MECWNIDPIDRPSFSKLEQMLGSMLEEADKQVTQIIQLV